MDVLVKDINLQDMKFKNYDAEQLYIESIYSRLTLEENKVRRAIMEYTISTGKAFNINGEDINVICKTVHMCLENVKSIIVSIEEKLGLVMDEDGNVNYIYPVCAIPTNHHVTLKDGRSFYAMCAVDAMGTAFTFKQDICIESACSKCGENVKVQVVNGKVKNFTPENLQILHVDLNKNTNWSGSC